MKVLQIISSAYRCTIEEQDDPAVWITHAMKGAGADFGVLLRGNAVNYAVEGQNATGLCFGKMEQTQPPRIDKDIAQLMEKGIDVLLVKEDSEARGIPETAFIGGIKNISRNDLPQIFSQYDQVWQW